MNKRPFALLFLLSSCTADLGASSVVERPDLQPAPPLTCDYPQAFGTAQHTGVACPEVSGMVVVARIEQDPDADAENAASGFLQIHEPPPLTFGDFVVVPHKSGFTTRSARSTEHYDVRTYRWSPSVGAPGATLAFAWSAPTDWQPVDGAVRSTSFVTNGYVAQFAPAIANGSVYVPAASGRLQRLDLKTGAVLATIDPFIGTPFVGDPHVVVNNALSFDANGNVYYTVVAWPAAASPFVGTPNRGQWLVRVSPDNAARLVDWSTIASSSIGVPQATDLCEYPFRTNNTPPPTGPDSKPPLFGCGAQRPAMNAPVAIKPNGNLVVYSYANNAQGAAFLIEVNAATLQPMRAADTRGHLHHGCGVRLPLTFSRCNLLTAGGTVNIGNDPNFNGPVRFTGPDIMDSAPAIAPDGSWSIAGYDGGFSFGGDYDARGAAVLFRGDGSFLTVNTSFGWEVTASAWRHDETFSYLQDNNHYSDFDLAVGQFSPSEQLEVPNTIPLSVDPVAIDFLDAHIVFGPAGDRYAINGDGHLYKFTPSSKFPVESVALLRDDGSILSMETESNYLARDRVGRIYASYAGSVWVIDSSGTTTTSVLQPGLTEAQRAGVAARREAARNAEHLAPPAL